MIVRIPTVVFSTLTIFSAMLPTLAQGSSSSSESSSYHRGFGSTQANVFAPKYKERLKAWSEQITMGKEKGWLTVEEIERFTADHGRLTEVHASLESQNYPKAETDAMEQKFNAFNVLLSQAMSKPAPNAVPAVVPANVSPVVREGTPAAAAVKKATVVTKTATPVKAGTPVSKKTITAAKKTPIKKH